MKTQLLLENEKGRYERVAPPCPYFGTCGGCTLQDLCYKDQLNFKRERLQRDLAPFETVARIELVGLDDPWRYRNKAELTFGAFEGNMILGYHAARSFWRIVDLEDCLLLPEPLTRVMRDVRSLAAESGLSAYHPKTHQGFFRHLLVRSSRRTGKVMLGLITAPGQREIIESMADVLMERHQELSSIYWGISSKIADIAIPDELFHLRGAEYLDEQMGPFHIRLHPFSFIQPTSVQAERIYEQLCDALSWCQAGVAWDLYCGIGIIAFYLSRKVSKVYGIDIEPHHLDLARLNASANGLDNVTFYAGRVENLLLDRNFWLKEAKPDIVVADPPRAGLHPGALTSLLAARPRSIAYLSCNPQSLVRDLNELTTSFPKYRVVSIQAFDMFPQTIHLEVLAILKR